MSPKPRGRFITLEGGEGAGKSTLLESLCKELTARGQLVLKTREPGGSSLAEKIRQLLLHAPGVIVPKAELLLFLAARAQHLQEKILPALAEGMTVICDRFSDSTIAYQAFARGLSLDEVETLDRIACGGLKPDRTLLLDIEPEEAFSRISTRGRDRMEKEGTLFHKKVHEGFLYLAARDSERIVVIDARGSAADVLQAALAAL